MLCSAVGADSDMCVLNHCRFAMHLDVVFREDLIHDRSLATFLTLVAKHSKCTFLLKNGDFGILAGAAGSGYLPEWGNHLVQSTAGQSAVAYSLLSRFTLET